MTENDIVVTAVLADGQPIPLGVGIPVNGPGVEASVRVTVVSGKWGRFTFPVHNPGPGPDDGAWGQARHRGPLGPDPLQFQKLYGAQAGGLAPTIPFGGLSAAEAFWVPDPEGRHVALVGGVLRAIRPLAPELAGGFWVLCKEGLEDPKSLLWSTQERAEWEEAGQPMAHRCQQVWADREILFCLHPAPRGHVWSFGSTQGIRIGRSADGEWEAAFEAVAQGENLLGAAWRASDW